MVRDQAQYYRLDTAERSRSLQDWNHPVYWPVLAVLAVLAAMAWGAVKILRARDQQTALPRPVPSSQRGR
jgi:hypothetical protein